ncbi:hypothetical protein [Streptomyces lichenis]|uniref:Tetratricopeptide repeat protein n=1 Tax=Streptomyces lichenis TaxID=2306967 RepID=A0ABT0I6N3_9ACTN|nr:hypothetical protein [Streptomyces lichenis]MCK8676980.1 hypothetical protein [Streptomyces lichenis]
MTDSHPDVLSPRDEARLELSSRARTVAEGAAALVPVAIDPEPGSLITAAADLLARAEELLTAAAIAERERGLSPERIKELAGHRYWARVVLDWAEDGRRNRSGMPGPVLAESLDKWVTRETADAARPVTDGLDATRFPGSAPYEAYQRDRAKGPYAALAEAVKERGEAWEALNELTEEDDDGNGEDHPVNLRVVASCRRLASAYRELSSADPAFAYEYLDEAVSFERTADRFAKEGPFA